jgi:hypothetical protein
MKTALAKLSDEQKKAFASLMGKTEVAGSGATAGAGGRVITGYVTAVEGDNVTVDIGSAQGLQPGSHLAVFKASDTTTRVGVMEIQQVIDAGNSRARLLTMNPGVQPEFGDIVRLE